MDPPPPPTEKFSGSEHEKYSKDTKWSEIMYKKESEVQMRDQVNAGRRGVHVIVYFAY